QEVPVNGRASLDVALQPQAVMGEEMVVVGYGTQRREDVTSSIASIDVAEVIESKSITNISQLLQGRVPGLQVGIATTAEGQTNLQVRGVTSLTAGNDPLIVVDGVPFYGNLADLNPNSIQNIDVLKGASAAAAYGASAANGVIEVTTKQRGNTSKPSITFRASTQLATPGRVVEPYNADEYVKYKADYLRTNNPENADKFTPPNGDFKDKAFLEKIGLEPYEIQNYLNGNTINWWDQVNRERALRQKYDVGIGGDTGDFQYYASLGYLNNEAQAVGGKYETVRTRLNISGEPTDWLKIGINSNYARRNESFLGASLERAFDVSPIGKKYQEDGSLEPYPHGDNRAYNPLIYTKESGRKREDISHNINGTLFAKIDLPYKLSFKTSWNSNFRLNHTYSFDPSIQPLAGATANASRSESNDHHWFFTNQLTWNQAFGGIHDVEATLLYQAEARNYRSTTARNEGFALESLGFGNLGGGEDPSVSSSDLRSTGTGAMARIHYRFKDRYLATVTYRRDGYSAFGTQNPYAYFPSASVGWRLSDEPFFDFDMVNNLKLRLSWGVNGNRDIGVYSPLQRLNTNNYQYEGQTVTGIYASNLPNKGLQWEETTQYNIGVDFSLFDDRLSGTIDTYYSSTENLILDRSLPDITSFPSITTNLGQVDNRGIEVSVSTVNISTKHSSWGSTVNFSLNRNEIVELYGNGEDDVTNEWFLGESIHRIWDYKTMGVYQQKDVQEAAEYNKRPGDFRIKDVNDDGTYTPLDDKVFLGYTEPRYRVSLQNQFSYKQFTVSALLNSWIGYKRSNIWRTHAGDGAWQYGRFNRPDYPYWTPENPTNEWARLGSTYRPSFNYWEDATFIRLQNLSVSYQLPKAVVKQITARSVRVFFNAQNVATITGYSGNDPETGSLNTPRLYSLGINVKF
ncbi:MAG TPA: SusC/RagA family TonB-linked outer membrane protein, partial [Fodinibius sp.]|nr:SusC/RagA family TonB-linked outer membrane protein [Fodinibius sp.]